MKRFDSLYRIRFEMFFFSILLIVFGSLIFPEQLFQDEIIHVFFLLNILSGIVLVSKTRNLLYSYGIIFLIGVLAFAYTLNRSLAVEVDFKVLRLSVYVLFYGLITWEMGRQVLRAERVGKNVIIGVMSAFISLGLITFFIFLSIELLHSGSFGGNALLGATMEQSSDTLLYFSYITILTIGYGDVVPITPIAQKATVLAGLIGQFYLVIIVAVVVGKYISHSKN